MKLTKIIATVMAAVLLAACGGNKNQSAMFLYDE